MGILALFKRLADNTRALTSEVMNAHRDEALMELTASDFYSTLIPNQRPSVLTIRDLLQVSEQSIKDWGFWEPKRHYLCLQPFAKFLRSRGYHRIWAFIDPGADLTLIWAVQRYAGKDRNRYFGFTVNDGLVHPVQVGCTNRPPHEMGRLMTLATIHPHHTIDFDHTQSYSGAAASLPNCLEDPTTPSAAGTFPLIGLPSEIASLVIETLIENGHFVFEPDRPNLPRHIQYCVPTALSGCGLRATCSSLRAEFDRLLLLKANQRNHIARIDHNNYEQIRNGAVQFDGQEDIQLGLPREDGQLQVLYECGLSQMDTLPPEASANLMDFLERVFRARPRTTSVRMLMAYHAQPMSGDSTVLYLNDVRDAVHDAFVHHFRRQLHDTTISPDVKIDLEAILLRPTSCLPLSTHPPIRFPEYRFLSFSNQPSQEPHIFHDEDTFSLLDMANGTLDSPSQHIKDLRTAFLWTHAPPALCNLHDYTDVRTLVNFRGVDIIRARKGENQDGMVVKYRRKEPVDVIRDGWQR